MENISYIGLSQQLALQQQIETTANNLANMTTPGFKSQNVLFLDLVTKPKDGAPINQSYSYGTYRDLAAGNMTQTHNPLDVAINGKGYFAVQTPDGATRYTRDGSFSLNTNSELVDQSGNQVLSDGGNPIVMQANARQVTISADGAISTEQGTVGKLKLVNFENEQALTNIGANLLDAGDQAEQPVDDRHLAQGVVEGSNVSPVTEMNKMIELMRMFQATQTMLQNDHDRIVSAIQKLSSTQA